MAVMLIEPIPSASLILLRDSPLEVLMIRRHEKASFVPDAWVFPGGAVEADDGDDMRITAIRETREETGISIDDPARLVLTSRWITPVGAPKRFDTWFYLAKADEGTAATFDGTEAVDALWITPQRALGELKMVFPTIRNLEALRGFDSADALIASRIGAVIEPVQPILVNGKPTLP